MATVAAIFDDQSALEAALKALEAAGLGDDIVQVSESREADRAPEETQTPNDQESTLPPVAASGGLMGGGMNAQAAAPLFGNVFSADGGADGELSRQLGKLGDAAEPFRLAAGQGGKLLFLETRDVDKAVQTLEQADAQQVYDPR